MKITIEATSEEVKGLLQATVNSEEQIENNCNYEWTADGELKRKAGI
ncbi:hypothetical protein [Enterococcus entomosocium]|nr:hypothetical protein [Enterococcus entomosocium]